MDVSVNLGVNARESPTRCPRLDGIAERHRQDRPRRGICAGRERRQGEGSRRRPVGLEDLAETVKKGELNFDVVIATPDAMRVVGQLGQILGPRGLMPNPKVGTVTADVEARSRMPRPARFVTAPTRPESSIARSASADFEVTALLKKT